jgi:hypothetical protein
MLIESRFFFKPSVTRPTLRLVELPSRKPVRWSANRHPLDRLDLEIASQISAPRQQAPRTFHARDGRRVYAGNGSGLGNRQRGYSCRGASGGVLMAIDKFKHRIQPGAECVAMLHDRGEGRLGTVYLDDWAREHFGDVFWFWSDKAEEELHRAMMS